MTSIRHVPRGEVQRHVSPTFSAGLQPAERKVASRARDHSKPVFLPPKTGTDGELEALRRAVVGA